MTKQAQRQTVDYYTPSGRFTHFDPKPLQFRRALYALAIGFVAALIAWLT